MISETINTNPLTIILIGPSGSGKGTQAQYLIDKFGFEYIEMGSIIREEAKKDTALGNRIDKIVMKEGKLLPDEISYDLLKDRILSIPKDKNLIIDGYPRTLRQVDDLDKMLKEASRNKIIAFNIDVPEEVSVKRLSKRLVCEECKANFKEDGLQVNSICPKCKEGKLYKRADDTPAKVKERLKWASEKVRPAIEEYRKRGVLIDIDGDQALKDVYNDIVKHIKGHLPG